MLSASPIQALVDNIITQSPKEDRRGAIQTKFCHSSEGGLPELGQNASGSRFGKRAGRLDARGQESLGSGSSDGGRDARP